MWEKCFAKLTNVCVGLNTIFGVISFPYFLKNRAFEFVLMFDLCHVALTFLRAPVLRAISLVLRLNICSVKIVSGYSSDTCIIEQWRFIERVGLGAWFFVA